MEKSEINVIVSIDSRVTSEEYWSMIRCELQTSYDTCSHIYIKGQFSEEYRSMIRCKIDNYLYTSDHPQPHPTLYLYTSDHSSLIPLHFSIN
jgi:hypothetical protein